MSKYKQRMIKKGVLYSLLLYLIKVIKKKLLFFSNIEIFKIKKRWSFYNKYLSVITQKTPF